MSDRKTVKPPITSAFASLADLLKAADADTHLPELVKAEMTLAQMPRVTAAELVSAGLPLGPAKRIAEKAADFA